uniref:Uncharacterized protein n=1 Tax=Pipistrellus kuhlii TaxID=59472 RepID=A0A7J7VMY2_PIPKU|nr:hypothetical protein mPipKuh1_008379 [Pipistrellus kuhlii]
MQDVQSIGRPDRFKRFPGMTHIRQLWKPLQGLRKSSHRPFRKSAFGSFLGEGMKSSRYCQRGKDANSLAMLVSFSHSSESQCMPTGRKRSCWGLKMAFNHCKWKQIFWNFSRPRVKGYKTTG